MMRIRDPAYHVDADADADPDPTFQFDRPMRIRIHNTVQNSDLLQRLIFNQHKAKTARSMKQKMLSKQITKEMQESINIKRQENRVKTERKFKKEKTYERKRDERKI
jgi:hypothetical protein